MARLDVNRSGEMEVFVKVVDLGGFSAAARAFRMTPSAVSKLVARLEGRLGARLVNRSTRKLQLTPEGVTFYERSVRVLADLEEAERGAATSTTPRGLLRVNASVPFGRHFLLPLVPEFLARHPAVCLDLVLTDAVVDLLEERTDVAIRSGPLKSSDLVARKLGETRMVIVGAPAYLKRAGTPATPRELARHNLLRFGYARAVEGWPLVERGAPITVMPRGNAHASDGEALRQLALGGLGLARLAAFQVKEDMAAGRLVAVLEDFNPGDTEPIHAVFLGAGGQLPARVRAFLDHLAAKVRLD
ncbi:LysR family transcriptional regulator [Pyxidicoccus sp. MSG2]|uniref:LysR family transcriptional regulator n=1 Tax=Pyxidicoccus sp. MSG2 TaxID=2996790 RepID=UPI00226EBE94|nr:LysR family transcriptional regulator [Pyxidicoccus sp. MSG2]MCY1019845.1 LysR family transcriptional regulator [Pyxidicoccus sp. MSG2]